DTQVDLIVFRSDVFLINLRHLLHELESRICVKLFQYRRSITRKQILQTIVRSKCRTVNLRSKLSRVSRFQRSGNKLRRGILGVVGDEALKYFLIYRFIEVFVESFEILDQIGFAIIERLFAARLVDLRQLYKLISNLRQ